MCFVQMRREATHAATISSSSEEELPPGHGIHCNHQKDQKYDKELATLDPITSQKLETDHVEWLSPDGSLKMCYNLSTLVQIAVSKKQWREVYCIDHLLV